MGEKQLKFFNIQEEKQNKRALSVSIDTLFLSLIIVVLLVIFSYVLGIEKGKRMNTFSPYLKETVSQTLALSKSQPSTKGKEKDSLSNTENASPRKERKSQEKEEKKRDEQPKLFKKYVIQVASYKNKSIAEREKKLLEEKGYSVIISRKGNYLAIFVGEYTTKKEAETQLKYLRNRYKDCFIRRL